MRVLDGSGQGQSARYIPQAESSGAGVVEIKRAQAADFIVLVQGNGPARAGGVIGQRGSATLIGARQGARGGQDASGLVDGAAGCELNAVGTGRDCAAQGQVAVVGAIPVSLDGDKAG